MRTLLAAGVALAAATAVAAEIAPEARRSGYDFDSPEIRAMQDDETANPGMLWVSQGESLWARKAGAAAKSCQDCHGDAETSMKGVATRYPSFDAVWARPLDLEQRINRCRTEHQRAEPLAWESEELLALTAFVTRQSRGLPIAVTASPELRPFLYLGKELFHRREGQLNLSCSQCHDDNWGKRLAGNVIPQGPPDRLSDLSSRMAEPRFAAAASAQLHDGRARQALRLWRSASRRPRTLPDGAGPRHVGGRPGGAPVSG